MALIKSRKDIEIVFLYGVPFSCSALLRKQTIDISLGAGHQLFQKLLTLQDPPFFRLEGVSPELRGLLGVWPT